MRDGRLAVSGLGEVRRGHDEVLGREVAVKLLRPASSDEEEAMRGFRRVLTEEGLVKPADVSTACSADAAA